MTDSLPPFMTEYLARRDAERTAAVKAVTALMSVREIALFRDAAVMGYVQGTRHPEGADHPKDSDAVFMVLDACLAFPDLYPAVDAVRRSTAVPGDLTDTERQFLSLALDRAAEDLLLGPGLTGEDREALRRLRRLAGEEA